MRKGIANDPGRRQRIRDAAAAVIAEEGVEAATYRRVAAHAEVPLGSMTYYFPKLTDLITSAFELLGEQLRPRYDTPLRDAVDRQAAIEVLVEATCGSTRATPEQLRLGREMHRCGSRSPTVAAQIASLEAEAIDALRTHFTEPAARALDALVGGLVGPPVLEPRTAGSRHGAPSLHQPGPGIRRTRRPRKTRRTRRT